MVRYRREPRIADDRKKDLFSCRDLWKKFGPDHLDVYYTYLWTLDQILKDNGFKLVEELRDCKSALAYLTSMDENDKHQLAEALRKCFVDGQWNDFMNLDIVESPEERYALAGRLCYFFTGWQATRDSWFEPYKGDAPQRIWNCIMTHYGGRTCPSRYANLSAVVQSSGMGKSRAVDELGRTHLVIPLCVRSGSSGYPPPDVSVRNFLTAPVDNLENARLRWLAFLLSLFTKVLNEIRIAWDSGLVGAKMGLISWFHDKISAPDDNEYRERFFDAVLSDTKTFQRDVEMSAEENSSRYATVSLQHAVGELADFLRAIDPLNMADEVEIILALDEAHALMDCASADRKWNMLSIFQEALHVLSDYPLWVILMSTSFSVSRFSRYNLDSSVPKFRRVDVSPVPALSELGYDIFAPQVEMLRGNTSLHERRNPTMQPAWEEQLADDLGTILTLGLANHVKFMARFGRPLFALRYKYGDMGTRANMLEFAMEKLICKKLSFLSSENNSAMSGEIAFAVLSQRLHLQLDSMISRYDEERQIEAHMRVILRLKVGNWCMASAPGSEPLLAEGAAIIMMSDGIEPAKMLQRILETFAIEGSCDKLPALLAVTLARDSVIKTNMKSFRPLLLRSILQGSSEVAWRKFESEEATFRVAKVSDFLGALFQFDDTQQPGDLTSDVLESNLYFNHFIRGTTKLTLSLRSLMLCMVRGAGFHCVNYVPGVDFVLPVLFGSTFRLNCISAILVRSVNGGEESVRDVFSRMDQATITLVEDMPIKRPVIRIVFALDAEQRLEHRKSNILVHGQSFGIYDIWCGGIGGHFLPHRVDDDDAWRALIAKSMEVEEENRQYEEKCRRETPEWVRKEIDPEYLAWFHEP